MTISKVHSAVIPQAALAAAISHLNATGFRASVLQPDRGPVEIAISYLPRRRETALQQFERAQYETTYWRLRGVADGTALITSDQFREEWACADIGEAVSALAGITSKSGRA
jgi:hypothetical protein